MRLIVPHPQFEFTVLPAQAYLANKKRIPMGLPQPLLNSAALGLPLMALLAATAQWCILCPVLKDWAMQKKQMATGLVRPIRKVPMGHPIETRATAFFATGIAALTANVAWWR
jgi:hypothetical protein